jgi:hypothetical protein
MISTGNAFRLLIHIVGQIYLVGGVAAGRRWNVDGRTVGTDAVGVRCWLGVRIAEEVAAGGAVLFIEARTLDAVGGFVRVIQVKVVTHLVDKNLVPI